MTKKTYKVQGMDCPSCAMVIESDLEDAGIKCKCDFVKAELEVEIESEEHEQKVHEIVKTSGYTLINS
ncbi:MAG: cation transporter [Patescibacteria group bacterium]